MMKHRSTVIFVFIVMVLAVAPQAAQQLDELRKTAAAQVDGAIRNAFISLHTPSRKTAGGARRQPSDVPAAVELCPHHQVDAALASRSDRDTRGVSTAQRAASGSPAREHRSAERASVDDGLQAGMLARHDSKDNVFSFDLDLERGVVLDTTTDVRLALPLSNPKAGGKRSAKSSVKVVKSFDEREIVRALVEMKDAASRRGGALRLEQFVERKMRQNALRGEMRRQPAEVFEFKADAEKPATAPLTVNVLGVKAQSRVMPLVPMPPSGVPRCPNAATPIAPASETE